MLNEVIKLLLPYDFWWTISEKLNGESHRSNFGANLCRQRYRLYTLFSSSNRLLHLHKLRHRIMDADELTFLHAEAHRLPESWSQSSLDKNHIDSSLWFHPKKLMWDLLLTPIWTTRTDSFRRNGHKRQLFLPYFSVQVCDQNMVCYIYY